MIIIALFLYNVLLAGIGNAEVQDKPDEGDMKALEVNLMIAQANDLLNQSIDQSVVLMNDVEKLLFATKPDTLHVKYLLLKGEIESLYGDNTLSMEYYQNAIGLADSLQFESGLGAAYLKSGKIIYHWGDYEHAFNLFSKGYRLAKKLKDQNLEALALNMIGKYNHTKGNFDESVRYYQKAIDVAQNLPEKKLVAELYLNLGKTNLLAGNIYKAMHNYLTAYEFAGTIDDYLIKADVYNHLGSIYCLFKQYEKSIAFHKEALELRARVNAKREMASSYNNIGETLLAMNFPDSAMAYFEQSYNICLLTGYKKGTVKSTTNLGRVFNARGEYDTARQWLQQSLEMAKEAGYDAGMVESSYELARNHFFLSDYEVAVELYLFSLSRMEQSVFEEFRTKALHGLYESYREMANYPSSLKYLEQYTLAQLDATRAENNRQLAELRVTFDMELKEQENEALRRENLFKEAALKKKGIINWLIVALLMLIFSLLLLLWGRYVNKQRANVQLTKLNKELELANIEKDKMFSIIAHELRNPLFWFQTLTETLSKRYADLPPQKLQKSLASLNDSAKHAFHLMDNLFNWSRARLKRVSPRFTVCSLDKMIDDSLKMNQFICEQKKINLEYELKDIKKVYADPDLLDCVLRNLISNAIKYTPDHGQVTISAKPHGTMCMITVVDNGLGINPNVLNKLFDKNDFSSNQGLMDEKGSGLGLKLCKEFVELNGGSIWYSGNDLQGASFSFTVPLAG